MGTRALRPRRLLRRCGSMLATMGALALLPGCGTSVDSKLDRVRALQDVGRFEASVGTLRELLLNEPDHPEASYRLGLAWVQLGEPSRAVWPLQKAAETPDYAIPAGVLLASTLVKMGNFDDAIRAADRVLESDPERLAALRIRANANLSARRLENALADARILVERFPEDWGVRGLYASVLAELGRLEAAEREHQRVKELGAASDDPALRSRACLAPALFADQVLEDPVRAHALYSECADARPTDISVLNHLVGFFDRQGELARGTELWRHAIEAAPEKLGLRQGLALRLQAVGEPAEAEDTLRAAVRSFDSPAAWNLLAGFYRARNEPGKALDAIENGIERGGAIDPGIEFLRIDVLIDLGELERARTATEALDQPTYAQLLRGRIFLSEGDAANALASFEEGIRAWPNNAAARYLAGVAARDLGDYERARSEFREAVRANNAETDAALELARLLFELREYEEAVQFANFATGGRGGPRRPEPYAIAARSLSALGQPERAKAAIAALERHGLEIEAVRERAWIARAQQGPGQSQAVLSASGRDLSSPEHRPLLELAVENLLQLDDAEAALEAVAAALRAAPEDPALLAMRGAAFQALGRFGDAGASLERGLALADDHPALLAALGSLRAAEGRTEEAVQHYDAAYAASPREGRYGYASAQLLAGDGQREAARARLRALTQRHPGLPGPRNDLAWLLAEQEEELDRALVLAEQARRLDPRPAMLDTLGWVHFKRGEHAKAVSVFEAALADDPNNASTRYRLARALEAAGDSDRARATFDKALRSGPFPEAEDARRRLASSSDG